MAKVQIFGDLDNITNKRGTNELVLKFITQEVTDEEAGIVMSLRNKYVCLLLSTSEIDEKEAQAVPDEFHTQAMLEGKSPSQRLRNVLFRLWESRYKTRYPEFDHFYDARMEQIIDEQKSHI